MDESIEEAIKLKEELEKEIEMQEHKLNTLDAHKRTMILALSNSETVLHYPFITGAKNNSMPRAICDQNPFYVISLGNIPNPLNRTFFGMAIYPSGYKILRPFNKHRNIKSSNPYVFYTSGIIYKNGTRLFYIKDDENNIIRGANIFEAFSQWFDFSIPFKNIEEWLGLFNGQIIRDLSQMARIEGSLNS